MKRSQADQTTAKNLEDKFDRAEEVLDYFEVTKARVINPRSKGSVVKRKFAHSAKRSSDRHAAVRENQRVITVRNSPSLSILAAS